MNTELYLKKLNVSLRTPSLEFLNELIAAHQSLISFNNLDVYFNRGVILNLDEEALFEKVILKGKGGYCHENNKIFYLLLKELGFTVKSKLARVILDRTGDLPRTHRTTIVTLNGKDFLADVGFGRHTPPQAVAVDSNVCGCNQISKKNELYTLELLKENQVIGLYTFDYYDYQESDFNVSNYYTNTHPDSKFLKELIMTKNDHGVIELINGKNYSKIENNERLNVEIKNQEEFQTYLKNFGITDFYDYSKL